MVSILHLLPIRADRKVIFEAISTQKGMSKWWTRDCFVEPKIGFVNIFKFGKLIVNKMKVVELVPDTRLSWECVESIDEWIGTRIIFEIGDKEELHFLRFRHEGWQAATDIFASCNYNWARYLISLKDFCETGTGNPFDIDMDAGLEETNALNSNPPL